MKKGFIYSVNKRKKLFASESWQDIIIPKIGGFLFEPIPLNEVPFDDVEWVNNIPRMAREIPDLILYIVPLGKGPFYKVTYFEGRPPL